MTPSHDPITLVCGGVYIVLALYIAGLWAFALLRTGMVFCYFYIVAALVGAFISVVSVAMYFDPHIWVRLLGKAGWRISYYFIIVVQPIGVLIGATGATILVRWLTRRSNQPRGCVKSPRLKNPTREDDL
jgi:MFS family permease